MSATKPREVIWGGRIAAAVREADRRALRCGTVLKIDPEHYPDRARRGFDNHLARAKWAARTGYKELIRRGWSSRSQCQSRLVLERMQ